MSAREYPQRLRIWGADGVCAARPEPALWPLVTACGHLVVTPDERRDRTEAVSCRRCVQAIAKETQ